MKKAISVLLVAMMLLSCFGLACAVGAEAVGIGEVPLSGVCTCSNHDGSTGLCHCCVFCPTLDKTYLTSCAKNTSPDGSFDGSVCCSACTGIWPCNCGCSCCREGGIIDDDPKLPITPDQQQSFVEAFQAVLKKISDVFDKIFERIFEFLQIDKILGTN